MLGDTLTATLGGSGGTAVVTNKISEGNNASEYLKKRANDEVRVRIRHSNDTVKAGTQPFERHNVLIEQYVYPTTEKPLGVRRQVQLIIRNDPTDAEVGVVDLAEALTYWADSTILSKLFGWEV